MNYPGTQKVEGRKPGMEREQQEASPMGKKGKKNVVLIGGCVNGEIGVLESRWGAQARG